MDINNLILKMTKSIQSTIDTMNDLKVQFEDIKPTCSEKKKSSIVAPTKSTPIPKAKIVDEHTTSIQNIHALYEIMYSKYRFPDWILSKFKNRSFWNGYMRSACVYYPQGASLEIVKKLVKEREPVNMARNRPFDEDKMLTYFGWNRGFYDRYYEKNRKLAPNIAIYTPTLLVTKTDEQKIHVLHAIGLAFDHPKQSDCQYFLGSTFKITLKKQKELEKVYKTIFKMIYKCAIDRGFTDVVLSGFGTYNFAKLYNEHNKKKILENVFIPAFESTVSECPKKMRFYTMGLGDSSHLFTSAYYHGDVGRFPACCNKFEDLDTVLFLNCFDMISIPGNGQKGDNSIDGFIGRYTCISVTGTSMTNPYLEKDESYIAV